jgi:hypothetical protein
MYWVCFPPEKVCLKHLSPWEGTYLTIMAEYMSKMDSALLMLSKIIYLVRNEEFIRISKASS